MDILRSDEAPSRGLTEYGSRNASVSFVTVDDGWSIVRIELGAGGVLGSHAGRRDQLFCVLSGSGTVRAGVESRAVSAGDVVRWSAGEQHETETDQGLVVLVISKRRPAAVRVSRPVGHLQGRTSDRGERSALLDSVRRQRSYVASFTGGYTRPSRDTELMEIPTTVDSATVLRYAVVTDHVRATGNTRHVQGGLSVDGQLVGGELIPPARALAIARYANEAGVYLFGLDEHGEVQSDTWHETVEDALAQAAYEYVGLVWRDATV